MSLESFTFGEFWGLVAVVLGFIAYGLYIKGIFAGKIKPHAFSWFIWALLTTIAFFAQVSENAGPGAWVTGFTALMSYAFVIVGLGSSSRTLIEKTDWFYFIGALLAIPPWYLTGDPLWSVIIVTVIDAVAFVPTFRKSYQNPETESITASTLHGVKFIFGIIALESFTLTTALYPASLILANLVFVAMLVWRRQSLART